MLGITVKAMKLTEDPHSTKLLYEKDGTLFIRNGGDGFTRGVKSQSPFVSLRNKWGFREVENPPTFRDGAEIQRSIHLFNLKEDGRISYSGRSNYL